MTSQIAHNKDVDAQTGGYVNAGNNSRYVKMQVLVERNIPINDNEIPIIVRKLLPPASCMDGFLLSLTGISMLYSHSPHIPLAPILSDRFRKSTHAVTRQRYSLQSTREICALLIVPPSSSRSTAPLRRARAAQGAHP